MRSYCLRVWGPYACFTRPEMKVERVSYEVMTPSAARAIFEAILWKPAIRWVVERIEVISPIRWTSVRRNEVGSKAVAGKRDFFIEEDRQQRAGRFLRDVDYRIHGHMELRTGAGQGNGIPKFLDMFERRADKGQCMMQPYLGCREFSAYFERLEATAALPSPIPVDRDLGWMLYDVDFRPTPNGTIAFKAQHGGEWAAVEGEAAPLFFKAHLDKGVLKVPVPGSAEVLQ